MPIDLNVCLYCNHYQGERSCKAFGLGGIPFEIWTGLDTHEKKVQGDNGIRLKYDKKYKDIIDLIRQDVGR